MQKVEILSLPRKEKENEIMEVLILLVAVCLQLYLAYLFYEVAKDKGYEGARYYVIPLLFSVIGYLWVIALRDLRAGQTSVENKANAAVVSDELPDL